MATAQLVLPSCSSPDAARLATGGETRSNRGRRRSGWRYVIVSPRSSARANGQSPKASGAEPIERVGPPCEALGSTARNLEVTGKIQSQPSSLNEHRPEPRSAARPRATSGRRLRSQRLLGLRW